MTDRIPLCGLRCCETLWETAEKGGRRFLWGIKNEHAEATKISIPTWLYCDNHTRLQASTTHMVQSML